jgi:hypothetical protein
LIPVRNGIFVVVVNLIKIENIYYAGTTGAIFELKSARPCNFEVASGTVKVNQHL